MQNIFIITIIIIIIIIRILYLFNTSSEWKHYSFPQSTYTYSLENFIINKSIKFDGFETDTTYGHFVKESNAQSKVHSAKCKVQSAK